MASGLRRQDGFTLLELAIVITAIGLVMGGIIVAQSMIRSAKINGVVSDIARYTAAYTDFRDKYIAIPGDMATAENFWGSDAGCPATPYTATPHVATCNGDGNGHIDGTREPFRAWQHMANAGFIDGLYTGVLGAGGAAHHQLDVNAPASTLDGGGFDIFWLGNKSGDANFYDGYYPVRLGIGAPSGTSYFYNPLFTPAEALAIDRKIDDGAPGTGNVMPYKSAVTPGCTTTDVSTTAEYAVASSAILCSLNIIITDPVK